mmetsp:Transcript_17793/g.23057  ORF Transcript_17793/g.23057 Transcript_17793/m.23057 type:complete len:174 (+) Transcript_17793:288-809(+)
MPPKKTIRSARGRLKNKVSQDADLSLSSEDDLPHKASVTKSNNDHMDSLDLDGGGNMPAESGVGGDIDSVDTFKLLTDTIQVVSRVDSTSNLEDFAHFITEKLELIMKSLMPSRLASSNLPPPTFKDVTHSGKEKVVLNTPEEVHLTTDSPRLDSLEHRFARMEKMMDFFFLS